MTFSHTFDPEALFATVRSHFERHRPGSWAQLTAAERLEIYNLYSDYERKRNDTTIALNAYEQTALAAIEKVRQRNTVGGERKSPLGSSETAI